MVEIGFLSKEYKRDETLDKFISRIEKAEKDKVAAYKEYMEHFFDDSGEHDETEEELAEIIAELVEKIDAALIVADNYARMNNYVLKEYLQHFFKDSIVCKDLINRPTNQPTVSVIGEGRYVFRTRHW